MTTFARKRPLMLQQADKYLAEARAITASGWLGYWDNNWNQFESCLMRAASGYAKSGLGTLSRRVIAAKEQFRLVWNCKPEGMQKFFDDSWRQFDEMNAKDIFHYATTPPKGSDK